MNRTKSVYYNICALLCIILLSVSMAFSQVAESAPSLPPAPLPAAIPALPPTPAPLPTQQLTPMPLPITAPAPVHQPAAVLASTPKRITIINAIDDGKPPIGASELGYLTDKLREIATEVLHNKNYVAVTGKTADTSSSYVCRTSIGRFGGDFTVKVELSENLSGVSVGFFTDNTKDLQGLLASINEKAPIMFKKLLQGQHAATPVAVPVAAAAAVAAPVAIVATQAFPAEQWGNADERVKSLLKSNAAAAGAIPSAAKAYTGSNPCHKEIFDLPKNNVSKFVTDLGVSVVKVQGLCKTKFTCPADNKVMDVGLTAGCIKQLPTSPAEITSLLTSIGMDLTANATIDFAAESIETIDAHIDGDENSGSVSRWVAWSLDILGVGLITYGIKKNGEVNDLHSQYKNLPYGFSPDFYEEQWEKVEDARSSRNMFYIVGSLVLAAGIGVHIWF